MRKSILEIVDFIKNNISKENREAVFKIMEYKIYKVDKYLEEISKSLEINKGILEWKSSDKVDKLILKEAFNKSKIGNYGKLIEEFDDLFNKSKMENFVSSSFFEILKFLCIPKLIKEAKNNKNNIEEVIKMIDNLEIFYKKEVKEISCMLDKDLEAVREIVLKLIKEEKNIKK